MQGILTFVMREFVILAACIIVTIVKHLLIVTLLMSCFSDHPSVKLKILTLDIISIIHKTQVIKGSNSKCLQIH